MPNGTNRWLMQAIVGAALTALLGSIGYLYKKVDELEEKVARQSRVINDQDTALSNAINDLGNLQVMVAKIPTDIPGPTRWEVLPAEDGE